VCFDGKIGHCTAESVFSKMGYGIIFLLLKCEIARTRSVGFHSPLAVRTGGGIFKAQIAVECEYLL
jgi:hypothetical protein